MADVHSKEIKSKNMAAIKGKNTKPVQRTPIENFSIII